jgi:hypothetical protein
MDLFRHRSYRLCSHRSSALKHPGRSIAGRTCDSVWAGLCDGSSGNHSVILATSFSSCQCANSSSRALAFFKSSVSKPSVNQL